MEREEYMARYGERFVGDLVPLAMGIVEECLDSYPGVTVPDAARAEARALVVLRYATADREHEAHGRPEMTAFREALLDDDPEFAADLATPEQLGYLGLLMRVMPTLDGALDDLVHRYGSMSMDSCGRYITTSGRD